MGRVRSVVCWTVARLASFLVAYCVLATSADAQTCPATDPNADYNCPVGPLYTLPGWGNVPWSLPQNYSTIRVGDLDGDGIDELIGRDAFGVHVWSWNAATATWMPVLTSDGRSELVLSGFSDAVGWVPLQYSSTLQLADLDKQPGAELIGRGIGGLLVYKFVKGPVTNFGFPTGSWSSLAQSGPFGDGACFSNGKCWNSAPYYTTIRFADIDGDGFVEAVAWGGDGLEVSKWNGSGWTAMQSQSFFGDAAQFPYDATAFRVLRIDNTTKAKALSLGANPDGMYAAEYDGGAWNRVNMPRGFFSDFVCNDSSTTMSCARTLQTAVLDSSGIPTIFARDTGCASDGGGLEGIRYQPSSSTWTLTFAMGPFDDCSGFAKPANFAAIQAADLTGDGISEVIGRGAGGIVAYQWTGSNWNQIVSDTPMLTDAVWASDASYYASIRTGKLATNRGAALIARGQNGIRTWTYANGAFNRPLPYGSYPTLDGNTYTQINTFLNLPNGVRNTYVNPSIDSSSSQLRSYISQLENARSGCTNEISADPPQYQTCDPLAGTSNPTYTLVVNQLLRELWYAAGTIDFFTTMQTVETALFTVQGTEFPSIADNLLLPQASGSSATADYLNLFGGILQLIGAITEQPEIGVVGNALSLAASTLPFFQSPQNTKLDQTFAGIATTIASMQQQMQSNNLTQKHLVLGDYGMLGIVGQLTGSQVWAIDEAGYLSINRQAFTQWVYQTFTPTIWSLWNVSACSNGQDQYGWDVWYCTPPAQTANIEPYPNGSANFFGLLVTNNTGCGKYCNGYGCSISCTWSQPDTNSVNMLFTPVSSQCTYTPGSGNAWVYGTAGGGGCTLGVGSAPFNNAGGWNFQINNLNVYDYATNTSLASRVEGVNGVAGNARIAIRSEAVLRPDVPDLRKLRFTLKQVLVELNGRGELLRDRVGNPFAPVTLQQTTVRDTANRVRLASAPGDAPRIFADIDLDRTYWKLDFRITANELTVLSPQMCVGSPPTARLRFELDVEGIGGTPDPYVIAQNDDWICEKDANGTIIGLRPLGSAAVETTFDR